MSERKNHASGQIRQRSAASSSAAPANEVADAGRVLVNGKPAKASYTVKITTTWSRSPSATGPSRSGVLSDVEQKGKDVAREMFEVIEG